MNPSTYKWNVVLATEDGGTTNYPFHTNWDPTKDFITPDSIAKAAAAQAFVFGGKKTQYLPVAASLVE